MERFELKEVQILEGHSDMVWSLDWNPTTGHAGIPLVFASCSGDKTVRIWEQNLSIGLFSCKVSLFPLLLLSKQSPAAARFVTTLVIPLAVSLPLIQHKTLVLWRRVVQVIRIQEHRGSCILRGWVWNNSLILIQRSWMKHTLERFDFVPGHRLGNCWLLQAFMPPLPYGKMLGVIECVATLEGHENEVKSVS